MNPGQENFYVTGGTLRSDAQCYLERQADRDLYDGLLKGEFCYVLTSRQMGKSSLMVRTVNRLRESGLHVIALDLTALGQNVTPEQWYDGLASRIGRQLRMEDEVEEFWYNHSRLSPVQRLMVTLQEKILPTLLEAGRETGRARDGRLVIFVDEIDTVRSLPFSTDEFFAAIRECYNRRPEEPDFQRLTFCLLGVATPSDLIRDLRTTPFNIGRRIELHDFSESEAFPLTKGLEIGDADGYCDSQLLLRRILYWTGGHPYLTQRLCQAVVDERQRHPHHPLSHENDHWKLVDGLCQELFFSARSREKDDNLLFVRDRLMRSEVDIAALLNCYEKVARGRLVLDDEINPIVNVLLLSGIVRAEESALVVRNRIYEQVFDREWIAANMPDAEIRRQKKAFWHGVLRTAAVAFLFVVSLSFLAVYSSQQARKARDASEQAEGVAQQMRNLLSLSQAMRGSQMLETSDPHGLLYLLQSAQTVTNDPALLRERATLLASWIDGYSARVQQLFGVEERVHRIRFSPEGKRIAIAWGKHVQLFEVDSGQKHGKALFHDEAVAELVFSQDGRYLATSSADRVARVWSVESAALVFKPPALSDRILTLGFAQNGRLIFSTTADGTTRFWEVASGQVHGSPIQHEPAPQLATASADGRVLACASTDGVVRFWNTDTRVSYGRNLRDSGVVRQMALSWDGKMLAFSSVDNPVRTWSVVLGRPHGMLDQLKEQIETLTFNPEGFLLCTASADSVRIWNLLHGGRPEGHRLRHQAPVTAVAFSPDGQSLAAGAYDGSARIWDPGLTWDLLEHSKTVGGVAFGPDGSFLIAATRNTARIWDLKSRQTKGKPITHASEIKAVACSPDGRFVATASVDNTAQIWSAETGEAVGSPFQHGRDVLALAFSPDSKLLATGASDSTCRVWNIETGKIDRELKEHTGSILAVSFSSDGKYLATGSVDSTARVWELEKGQPVTPPLRHSSTVTTVAFSPSQEWLATGSTDQTVRFWDLQTGLPVGQPLQHRKGLQGLFFSPNGQLLVTSDGMVRLWITSTRQLLGQPWASQGHVHEIAFNPADPQQMAICSCNQNLKLRRLPTPPDELIDLEFETWVALGARLDEQGGVESIDWQEWRDLRNRWQARRKEAGKEQVVALSPIIELETDEAEDYHTRGHDREKLGQFQLAIEEFTKAIERDPKNAHLYEARALNYRRLRDLEKAQADYLLAVEIEPDDPSACNNLAWFYVSSPPPFRDPQKAMPLAFKAALKKPNDFPILHTFGVTLYRLGQWKEALQALQKSIAANNGEENAHALFFLAMCHQQMGDSATAKSSYQKAVQWMAQNLESQLNDELLAFRMEAEEVLGLMQTAKASP